jgi:hypothetical protein
MLFQDRSAAEGSARSGFFAGDRATQSPMPSLDRRQVPLLTRERAPMAALSVGAVKAASTGVRVSPP